MNGKVKDYIIEALSNDLAGRLTVEEIQSLTDEEFDRLLAAANLRSSTAISDNLKSKDEAIESLRSSSVLFKVMFICSLIAACVWLAILISSMS